MSNVTNLTGMLFLAIQSVKAWSSSPRDVVNTTCSGYLSQSSFKAITGSKSRLISVDRLVMAAKVQLNPTNPMGL